MFTTLKRNIRENLQFINITYALSTKKRDLTVINTLSYTYIKQVVE